jgi:hypothetical protein
MLNTICGRELRGDKKYDWKIDSMKNDALDSASVDVVNTLYQNGTTLEMNTGDKKNLSFVITGCWNSECDSYYNYKIKKKNEKDKAKEKSKDKESENKDVNAIRDKLFEKIASIKLNDAIDIKYINVHQNLKNQYFTFKTVLPILSKDIDGIILAGDNVYPDRTMKIIDNLQKINKGFSCIDDKISKYIVLGNHEHDDCNYLCNQKIMSINDDKVIFPSAYYNIIYTLPNRKTINIIMIDTNILSDKYCTDKLNKNKLNDKQFNWLQRVLSVGDLKIVIGHEPIYALSHKTGKKMKILTSLDPNYVTLRDILIKNGVQYYICADEHNIQWLEERETKLQYIVVGGGGASGDYPAGYMMLKKGIKNENGRVLINDQIYLNGLFVCHGLVKMNINLENMKVFFEAGISNDVTIKNVIYKDIKQIDAYKSNKEMQIIAFDEVLKLTPVYKAPYIEENTYKDYIMATYKQVGGDIKAKYKSIKQLYLRLKAYNIR